MNSQHELTASTLRWYEPKWSYRPALDQSFREVINVRAILNIAVASIGVSAALLITMKLLIPNFVIPNLIPAVLSLPALILMMYLQAKLLAVFPPRVTLKRDCLLRSHGQSGMKIKTDKFLSAKLFFHRDDKVRLRIRYEGRRRVRTLKIGLPGDTDFDLLLSLIPVDTHVVDARNRMAAMADDSLDSRKPAIRHQLTSSDILHQL